MEVYSDSFYSLFIGSLLLEEALLLIVKSTCSFLLEIFCCSTFLSVPSSLNHGRNLLGARPFYLSVLTFVIVSRRRIILPEADPLFYITCITFLYSSAVCCGSVHSVHFSSIWCSLFRLKEKAEEEKSSHIERLILYNRSMGFSSTEKEAGCLTELCQLEKAADSYVMLTDSQRGRSIEAAACWRHGWRLGCVQRLQRLWRKRLLSILSVLLSFWLWLSLK